MTKRSPWLAWFVAWSAVIFCSNAHADDWDGLSHLTKLAHAARVDLRTPRQVNLSQLAATDALLIIGPRQSLPVSPITTFLREGGRVALLDDAGSGDRLLSAYQVSRRVPDLDAVPALRGDSSLLIAYPASEHPLAEGVPLLLTNRAVELHHPDLRPVFSFGRTPRALVLAGAIGAGRLVAVGDASVVINQMLAISAHRRFATNLLQYLSRPSGRVWLIAPGTDFEGSYGSGRSGLSHFDEWLRKASHPDLPGPALIVLSWAVLVVSAMIGVSLLPRRSPYLRPDLFPTPLMFAGYAGRVSMATQSGANLAWSLLDYKREFEAELAHRLGANVPLDVEQTVARAREAGMNATEARELESVLSSLSALDQTMTSDGSPAWIGARELGNVVRTGERLLLRLGNERE